MQPDQAANELTEEQVLNFLVNTLDEEIDIELGENAQIDSEDIWDVLVGCRADEDSVSHLCEISEESPHGNTILHHLRTKFELSELERVGKTLIQQDILELLPDRPVEVVPTSTSVRTTARSTTPRTNSTSHSLKLEQPRSTATLHSTRGCATNATRWRCRRVGSSVTS